MYNEKRLEKLTLKREVLIELRSDLVKGKRHYYSRIPPEFAGREEIFNQQLSEERAGRVRTFLISEGVEPSRITAIGFGESLPLVSNDTAAGRVQNRRVEIEIRPHDEVLQGS